MAKVTSYICEHTAEYALIPALKEILRDNFKFVTPIFPWVTREGGNTSRRLHGNDKFKMLGLYPRRPKLSASNYSQITIKINEEILYAKLSGDQASVPIIAGAPIASNFWELGKNPDCLWINLERNTTETFEIELIRKASSYHITQGTENVFQSGEDLIAYIDKNSQLIDLATAISSIRKIKMKSSDNGYSPWPFMGGYKPVYFLLR